LLNKKNKTGKMSGRNKAEEERKRRECKVKEGNKILIL
jgi:hypothetical protein